MLCAAQLKLATVGFSHVGLSDPQAAFYAEHFSVQLRLADEKNVVVTTPKDMAAVLGIEKQKQLLGCADESASCMAELAGALGADGFVTGQIARVGQSYQVSVKILAPEGTSALFLHSSKLLPTEEALLEELNSVAVRAVEKLQAGRGAAQAVVGEPPAVQVEGRPRAKYKLIPGAAGFIAFVVGGVALAQAGASWAKLTNRAGWSTLDAEAADAQRDSGKVALPVGLTLAIAGAVLIVASVVWYLLT